MKVKCGSCNLVYDVKDVDDKYCCPECKQVSSVTEDAEAAEKIEKLQKTVEEMKAKNVQLQMLLQEIKDRIPPTVTTIQPTKVHYVPLHELNHFNETSNELTVFSSIFTLFLGLLIPEIIHTGPFVPVSIVLLFIMLLTGAITYYYSGRVKSLWAKLEENAKKPLSGSSPS